MNYNMSNLIYVENKDMPHYRLNKNTQMQSFEKVFVSQM